MIPESAVAFVRSLAGVLFGLAVGLLATRFAGESPAHVAAILVRSAFGSPYDFGMTLFYTTPILLTGLSVATAFRAGLFNIGAEGQLTMGALAAAVVGICVPGASPWIAPWLAGLAAVCAGSIWGAIAGILRAKRGSHEVINTIMLNFIAAGLANYVTLYWIKNPETQNPESLPIAPAYLLRMLPGFGEAHVSTALPMAIALAVALWLFLGRTVRGFQLRCVGESEVVARNAGIDVAGTRIFAMALAGAIAGLVGVSEVLGHSGKFKMEFSPGFGFIGIAVALVARGNALGVIASALLFGALQKGTADLDLETDRITRDVSAVLQGLVILFVSADVLWMWIKPRVRRSKTEEKRV